MRKKIKHSFSSFGKGIMFGLGFVLIIAVFVGIGMSHSEDTTSNNCDSMEQHYKSMHGANSHHNMMNNNKMDCMDLDNNLSKEEYIAKMDTDNDGKCDICGMSVEHCIKMSEMQSISEHSQKSMIFDESKIFDMRERRNEK